MVLYKQHENEQNVKKWDCLYLLYLLPVTFQFRPSFLFIRHNPSTFVSSPLSLSLTFLFSLEFLSVSLFFFSLLFYLNFLFLHLLHILLFIVQPCLLNIYLLSFCCYSFNSHQTSSFSTFNTLSSHLHSFLKIFQSA